MPVSIVARERWTQQPSESDILTLDFTGVLASSETLSGTPTVAFVGDSGGTISAPAVNSGTITAKDGSIIAIGKAVQFRNVAGSTVGSYRIQVTVSTSDSNSKKGDGMLDIVD